MMVKITSFLGISGFHKIMEFNLLARMLMFRHLLFGLNIGFQRLGIEPYHRSINFSSETLMDLSRKILLSKGGIMILLMLRLLQKKEGQLRPNELRKRLWYISAPCFSLKPRYFRFKPFARIKGSEKYSICQIEILPSDGPSHLIHLHLKTLCKPKKPLNMSDSEYFKIMPQADRVYEFDVNEVSTRELTDRRSKATQNSISICAHCREYFATDIDNGSLKVSWQGKVTRIMRNAHGWLICATAFHQKLPFLATYCGLKEEKKVKIWYIPSGLSSDPVLVSSFHIPDGCVLSVIFHPTLPLIFCGKNNGDIEVWRAV